MIIHAIDRDQMRDLTAEAGDSLMMVLRRHGFHVESPCGGRGTCGKCLVDIDGIGPALACQTVIGRDIAGTDTTVRLPRRAKAMILIDGRMRDQALDPLVRRFEALVPPPTLACQLADDERFFQATGYAVPFSLLAQLPALLDSGSGQVRFIGRADTRTVLRFLPPAPEPATGLFGMAVDIGTTTLAAYLYDLDSGRRLGSTAMTNPQAAFGADVISRIARAGANAADAAELRRTILDAIGHMAAGLMSSSQTATGQTAPRHTAPSQTANSQMARPDALALFSLAGNTTMIHLLAGLPAANIARAPFNPVSVRAHVLPATELGIAGFPDALAVLLPSVASYVGADITAGVIALGLERPGEQTTLFIDIGTNGEIVLRHDDRLTACATAAGPAFEGASISSGMSGTSGAIDHVWLEGDDIRFTVISGDEDSGEPAAMPAGICGSGLVDAVAVLLDSGVMDETGRLGDEPGRLSPALRARLTISGGQPAFRFAGADETSHGRPILLTQKDIRELQNAKAAIAAGIRLLLRREGIAPDRLETVHLAGGFGQYLNVRSAQAIGLLPEDLTGRIVAAGNTSAMGAIAVLLNRTMLDEAQATARRMDYRELSSDPEFSDLFIDALMFPEQA